MTHKYFTLNKSRPISLVLILVIVALSMMVGCSKKVLETPVQAPVKALPISVTITVAADPSLEEINRKEPFAQLSEHVFDAYKPDKDLYNTLFNAIDKMETTVDISKFKLSVFEKRAAIDSMYDQVGLQFYYVNRMRLSKDSNSILITYNYKTDEVEKNKVIFYSKLSHLVYNVAPEDYSPLQKLFSVYDYISTHSDYTDDIEDSTTHTPYSILMNGKGICGGFSNLGYYVLNRVGIKTKYISNEPHAWNMVNIDGQNYLTDITWGVGNYGSTNNFLNTILMDDQERILSLDNNGIGGYPIIEGYPRETLIKPLPVTDKRFKAYYGFYNEYALDIENNLIYYSNEDGIKKMALDSKGVETVSPMHGTLLKTFNGILYFVNTDNMKLYKLESGKEAQLLDDSITVQSMNLISGILHYKGDGNEEKEKTINLNPFDESNFSINSSKHQESIIVTRQKTFKFDIGFSKNMNTGIIPKEAITLVNKEGQTLPIHMNWSEDGRILTVRSQVSLDKEEVVSLYVSKGIIADDVSKLEDDYDIKVNIQ